MKRLLIAGITNSGMDFMAQVFRTKHFVDNDAELYDVFVQAVDNTCVGNLPYTDQTAILCYRLGIKTIFFYRDPRDVVAIECNYQKDNALLMKSINSVGDQYAQYLGWLQEAKKHLGILPLSYEHMVKKPSEAAKEIKAFSKDFYPDFTTRIVEAHKNWEHSQVGKWKELFTTKHKQAFWKHPKNQEAMKCLGYYI